MYDYDESEAKKLRGSWERAMRNAQQDMQHLEEMGMSGYRSREQDKACEDDWYRTMISVKWLKSWCRMRFGATQEKPYRRAPWCCVLTDGNLHCNTVSTHVPLVEARSKAWLH